MQGEAIMPRYIIAQVVAVVTILIGWSVLVGGSILAYIWIDKAAVVALLPATLSTLINAMPNYVFLVPAACVFIFGFVVVFC